MLKTTITRIGQLLLVLKDVEKKHLAENRERRTAEQQEHGENTLRLGEEGEGNVALSNAANSSINRLPSRCMIRSSRHGENMLVVVCCFT